MIFSDSITLDKRIYYLSHALVCMKSDKAGAVPHVGVLYQEVEDTLQVAQIQSKVSAFKIIYDHMNKVMISETILLLF